MESIPSLLNRKYYYICYIPSLDEKFKVKIKFDTPLKVIKHGIIGYNQERKEEIVYSISDEY